MSVCMTLWDMTDELSLALIDLYMPPVSSYAALNALHLQLQRVLEMV